MAQVRGFLSGTFRFKAARQPLGLTAVAACMLLMQGGVMTASVHAWLDLQHAADFFNSPAIISRVSPSTPPRRLRFRKRSQAAPCPITAFDLLRADLKKRPPRPLEHDSWFHRTLKRLTTRFLTKHRETSRAIKWRERHPDADESELVEIIIRAYHLRTGLVGAMAGAMITSAQFAVFNGFGATVTIFVVALVELAVVERQQIRMVFTLADLFQYSLDNKHLHEVGDLYGQVLKIKGTTRAAAYTRSGSIALFRALSLRFLQRAAIKYCVPVVAVVVGGGMNWILTSMLGRHSVRRFRRVRTMSEHLGSALWSDQECQRLLISLMALMASSDGHIDRLERRFLLRTLSTLGVQGEDREALLESLEFREDLLFEQLHQRSDPEFNALVIEMLSIMAVADGVLHPHQRALMARVSVACEIDFDEAALLERHQQFIHKRRHARAQK